MQTAKGYFNSITISEDCPKKCTLYLHIIGCIAVPTLHVIKLIQTAWTFNGADPVKMTTAPEIKWSRFKSRHWPCCLPSMGSCRCLGTVLRSLHHRDPILVSSWLNDPWQRILKSFPSGWMWWFGVPAWLTPMLILGFTDSLPVGVLKKHADSQGAKISHVFAPLINTHSLSVDMKTLPHLLPWLAYGKLLMIFN